MWISGYNVISIFLKGASQKLIIGWVVGDPISFIDILGDNGLSENQPKKPFDVLIFGLKMIFDSRIIEYPADLLDDLNGRDQFKIQVDP